VDVVAEADLMSPVHDVAPRTLDHDIVIELDCEADVPGRGRSAIERWQRWMLLATDAGSIVTAWALIALVEPSPRRVAVVLAASLSAIAWLRLHGMYRVSSTKSRVHEVSHLYEAALLSAVVANMVDAHLGVRLGAVGLIAGTILGGAMLHAGRVIYRTALTRAHRSGHLLRPAVLVGAPDDVRPIATRFQATPELGYQVIATLDHPDPRSVANMARASGCDSVVIAPGAFAADQLASLIRNSTNAGLHVHVVGGMPGIDSRRVQIRPLGRDVCIHVDRISLDGWQVAVKRGFDVLTSVGAFIVLSPLLLLTAAAIKLSDGGPVLFRQERVGRDGRPFVMYKFRSMVVDAEARLREIQGSNQRSGPLFKLAHDPRITRVGRILRATSIDELPQLINVMKGEMSIVGPRPALADEVASFSPALRQRHAVLPGITGLWQVEGRDDPDFAVYEELDIFYVENWSVMLDITIILRTVWVLVRRVARKLTPGTSNTLVLD
jgi:exopolysaccharide biosynthesis polyprenyl glycosylphosphotransferase